jgi:hypothetical protein
LQSAPSTRAAERAVLFAPQGKHKQVFLSLEALFIAGGHYPVSLVTQGRQLY